MNSMHSIELFRKRVGAEAVGFFFIAMGLFLGMALATQSLAENSLGSHSIKNLGGPWGQSLASPMLRFFGIVSYLYPLSMIILGVLLAIRRTCWPRTRQLLALLFLTIILAGLAHLVPPVAETFRLADGIGGVIGSTLGQVLLNTVGYGGAVILLGFSSSITLVKTARPMVSKVRAHFATARFSESGC